MDEEPRLLALSEVVPTFLELVRRVEARADLAPLLEFDRDLYERTVSGDRQVVRTERVRLLAGEDGEVYHVPLDEEWRGEA
jgi:hypothetical protein